MQEGRCDIGLSSRNLKDEEKADGLTEYAGNKKLVSIIEYAAETLSGIPSIIYGLAGMLFFAGF